MRRNMELVRDLLLAAESGDDSRLAGYPPTERAGHALILMDAGLVVGVVSGTDKDPTRYMIHRLTWQGHEFLQSMRDERIWKKAKEHVLKPGASWTFEILKEWAKAELKERLGIPPA